MTPHRVNLNSYVYSDNTSSLDNDNMKIEYDSLCEINLKIINKNKILKTKRDLLEKEILELNEKIKKLERGKEIDIALIMEYLVNISKRRAFWSLNKYILKINDSDYQYAVSIKEDTAYPCLHSPKTTKETSPIRRIQERQYAVFKLYGNKIFWKISNVVSTPRNSNTPANPADIFTLVTGSTYQSCNDINIELGKEFLEELQMNAYHRWIDEDVINHIAMVLKMIDSIYILGVDSHQLRMKIFPLSLADEAKQWWINEGDGIITVWEELVEKFFCKFYPESYDGEEEMLDEGDNWGD
ncbi:hypothetical protein Tco_0213136 [Tanacetum coccineum]